MQIFPAGIDDITVINALAHQTWPTAYSAILSPDQLTYMLNLFYSAPALLRQMQEGQHFLIADFNDGPAGFAAWQLKDIELARLQKLYVLPELQGKNIGKDLLERVIAETRKAGALHLELNVNRYNKALSFYQNAGFEIVSSEDIDIGKGYFMNDYVMRKAL